jgi:hypothetical protein
MMKENSNTYPKYTNGEQSAKEIISPLSSINIKE